MNKIIYLSMMNNYQKVSNDNATTIGGGGGGDPQQHTDNHIFQSLPNNAKELYVERTNKELKVNKVSFYL
jgi:hypothetical protein